MNTYTTGEFARRANVSIRTIRFYDQKGVLKPTAVNDSGYRLYTDHDFAKLQKIIVLKNLGFTLEEIISITANDDDSNYLKQSFELQLQLVREKINDLKIIEQSIKEASGIIDIKKEEGWGEIIRMIHLHSMEESLAEQYKNSRNVDVRIDFHKRFSVQSEGWFEWIYSHMNLTSQMSLLELGCGNGELWHVNIDEIPPNMEIILSDISRGMLRSAEKRLKSGEKIKEFRCFDCHKIPFEDETFDVVVANHLMFYLKDRDQALNEISRVLKKGGHFYCTTYGRSHLKEIEQLVKEFDDRIALSEIKLYDIFGLDHGEEELGDYFSEVKKFIYEDCLIVDDVKALEDYILSCHGNQMKYLQGTLPIFEEYLKKKLGKLGMRISKDVGMFCCRK